MADGALAPDTVKQDRADPGEVFADVADGDFSDGHDAVFPAFALVDPQGALLQVEVVGGQVAKLHPAQAGRVEHLHDCPVSVSKRGADIGLRQPAQHLGVGDDSLGQAMRFPQLGELGKWIDHDLFPLFQERVKAGHGMDLGVTIAGGDGTTVHPAAGDKVIVIILQLPQSDVPDVGPVCLRGSHPSEKAFNVLDAGLDGERNQMLRVQMVSVKLDERIHGIRVGFKSPTPGDKPAALQPRGSRVDAFFHAPFSTLL